MLKINEQKFLEMDELSLQKVPFFFVIDFLMENVLIFSQEDLEAQKILLISQILKIFNHLRLKRKK